MKMNDIVISAMRKIILWREMYDMCMTRERCTGCPYKNNGTCDKESTQSVLRTSADIFQEFLDEE